MTANVSYYQSKKEFRVFVVNSFPNLIQLKKEGNQASFSELEFKIMPGIRRYVNERLTAAMTKGHFSKGKYKADDFIDQIFIEIYDSIDTIKNGKKFYVWLLKKTNDLLDNAIEKEEFDEFFFKNIDDYSKPEWDAMQEKYGVDAAGDFVMIEELDDMSYNHNDYVLNSVFIEDKEKGFIKTIDKDLSAEEIQNHITMVLHNLPSALQNVFDLTTNHHLDLEEIAQIRSSTVEEVEGLLIDAKKALQLSFFNRYELA
jgi:DNA-directed RNA polymerase specialized sigma24 family protein